MRASVLLVCALGASAAHATNLDKALLSASGGLMTEGSVQLHANLGDVIAGPTLPAATELWAGFWTPHMASVVAVEAPPATSIHYLASPRPNPTRTGIHLEFGLPAAERDVRLEIYDLAGGRVRRLVSGPQAVGVQRLRWNLQADSGGEVRAGVYFARLSTPRFEAVRKLVVLP